MSLSQTLLTHFFLDPNSPVHFLFQPVLYLHFASKKHPSPRLWPSSSTKPYPTHWRNPGLLIWASLDTLFFYSSVQGGIRKIKRRTDSWGSAASPAKRSSTRIQAKTTAVSFEANGSSELFVLRIIKSWIQLYSRSLSLLHPRSGYSLNLMTHVAPC